MSERFAALSRVCAAAVDEGVVPSAVVLVADEDAVRFRAAYGWRQLEPERHAVDLGTVFDVASVTKAVVTSVLAMRAVARGQIALDQPVGTYVPEFVGEGKAQVTVRHLLAHASGLPAHRPFYERLASAPSARFAICVAAAQEELAYAPGSKSVYSDLGFIVLGWLLERAVGARLDVQADEALFTPLGLRTTSFVNLADDGARARLLERHPVAATQRCPVRGRVVVGEVDDLNAHAMGGVAGHAGVFSSADDLGRLAAALVRAWRGDADAVVERDVIREFWRPAGIPGSTWRLGWDGPAASGSQAGERLSRDALGHLGFTGCSLWIDPARARWVVLLTNRVHPSVRDDQRWKAFRPAAHDAALDALDHPHGGW